jgi:hypothetical protein
MTYESYVQRYTEAFPNVSVEPQSLTSWINWRDRQRAAFPERPFLDSSLFLQSIPPSWEATEALITVLSDNSYRFTGVKQLPPDTHFINREPSLYIYEYIGDTIFLHEDYMMGDGGQYINGWEADSSVSLVWEFINRKGNESVYPYIYIPVREDYVPLLEGAGFLPKIAWWGSQSRGYDWPCKLYVLPIAMDRWEEWYTLTAPSGLIHPFIPTMVATGRATIQGDGNIIYEYVEVEGTYARLGELFVSSLQPSNLDWPLGVPREWMEDKCLPLLAYPSWGAHWHLGGYSGYRTKTGPTGYHPWITYYLYESPGGRAFLHEAAPDRLGRRNASFVFGDVGLIMSLEPPTNRYLARGEACGATVILVDDSYLPCGYEYDWPDYIGDCDLWDEEFWLGYRGSHASNYIDDSFPMVENVMLAEEYCLE